ncbi:hypothetical protein [Pedobacter borealis]|uniref:hypothetical protein n=1 Tax=Pedobacter borealis TaxID=475254 RepID=UPI000493096D|nr:hypothetical protein [Pedobacter borealis]
MKNSKVIIIMLFVFIAFSSKAQKGLQLKLQVGSKWYCELNSNSIRKMKKGGDSIVIVSENTLGSTFEVLREDKGLYDIKLTFSDIKSRKNSPMTENDVLFDSKKEEDMTGEMGENVKNILGKSYVFTITTDTRKVTGIKEKPDLENLSRPKDLEPDVSLFPQTDDELYRFVKKIFGGGIPDAQLVTGLKWDANLSVNTDGVNQIVNTIYTINRIEGRIIFIDMASKRSADGTPNGADFNFSGNFTAKGTASVDQTTGLLINSKSEENGNEVMKSDKGEDKWIITKLNLFTIKKLQ